MIVTTLEILGADAVSRIRALLDAAEWENGKANVAPGVKKNLQARPSPAVAECQQMILAALKSSEVFGATVLPAQTTVPILSRYETGMSYGRHVDGPIMGGTLRTDLAMTLFLSDPKSYEGGELEIDDSPAMKL